MGPPPVTVISINPEHAQVGWAKPVILMVSCWAWRLAVKKKLKKKRRGKKPAFAEATAGKAGELNKLSKNRLFIKQKVEKMESIKGGRYAPKIRRGGGDAARVEKQLRLMNNSKKLQ